MKCQVCQNECSDSLILARHVLGSEGHEQLKVWAESQVKTLRAGLNTSAERGVDLTKAMAFRTDTGEVIAEAERILRGERYA